MSIVALMHLDGLEAEFGVMVEEAVQVLQAVQHLHRCMVQGLRQGRHAARSCGAMHACGQPACRTLT